MGDRGEAFVSQFPLPPSKYFRRRSDDPGPPPCPAQGETYAMFGTTYATEDKLPSLEESGREVLYDPSKKRSEELKRLNKVLLTGFLDLVTTICTDRTPDAYVAKTENLETVLINMHHIINTYRPDQALQNIRRLLEKQTQVRRDVTWDLKEAEGKLESVLSAARAALGEPQNDENFFDAEASVRAVLNEFQSEEKEKKGDKKPMDSRRETRLAEGRQLIVDELERIIADPV